MQITKKLVYAAAMDAYERARRKGLSQDDCNNAYHDEFDRIWEFIGQQDGWLDLPAH